MTKTSAILLCLVCLTYFSNAATGQDLSDDITAPDVFILNGANTTQTIMNSVFESDLSTGVTGNTTGDIDFFNIVVDPGFQLDSINLDSFSGDGQAFIGFSENVLGGNSALASEQAAFVATALGFTLVDGSEGSLFQDLSLGADGTTPGIGFDPNVPLQAGTYAFVFQNTGPNVNDYQLTFSASVAVPEPATVSLVGLGLCLLPMRRRRN